MCFLDCGVFFIFRKWLEKPRTWKSKNYRIHQTSLIYVLWGRSVFFMFSGDGSIGLGFGNVKIQKYKHAAEFTYFRAPAGPRS